MSGVEHSSDEAVVPESDIPDLNNPSQVKARAKRFRAQEGLQKRFVGGLLATPEGREWMRALLIKCNAMPGSPAVCHSHVPGDPCSTAFNEGARGVGLFIIAQIPPQSLALLITDGANG